MLQLPLLLISRSRMLLPLLTLLLLLFPSLPPPPPQLRLRRSSPLLLPRCSPWALTLIWCVSRKRAPCARGKRPSWLDWSERRSSQARSEQERRRRDRRRRRSSNITSRCLLPAVALSPIEATATHSC